MKTAFLFLTTLLLFTDYQTERTTSTIERPIYFKGDVEMANTKEEIVIFLSNITEAGGGPIHMPSDYQDDRMFVLQQMPGQEKLNESLQLEAVHLTYFRNVLEIRWDKEKSLVFGLGNEILHPDSKERLRKFSRLQPIQNPYLGLGLAMMPKKIDDFPAFMGSHPLSIYDAGTVGTDCSKGPIYSAGGPGAIATRVNQNSVYCLEAFNACASTVEARCCTLDTTPAE